MRHMTYILPAALALIMGCTGNLGTDGETDGPIGHDSGSSEESATIIGQTTIGGEPVTCQVCITGDDGTDIAKPTGEEIQVPANVLLEIMAGNEAVGMDCEETPRPLHAHTDGTVWTYEHISEMIGANETLSVSIPLNRFIIGYYTFIVETWYFDEETGEYDIVRPTEEIDEPLFMRTMNGKWIESPDSGNEIAHVGNGGRYYTVDAELAFEPSERNEGDYIEDSWVEADTFWYRLYLEGYMKAEVTGMLVMEAGCGDE